MFQGVFKFEKKIGKRKFFFYDCNSKIVVNIFEKQFVVLVDVLNLCQRVLDCVKKEDDFWLLKLL